MSDAPRDRLLAAFSKAGAEQGYAGLDLETVVRYAGLGVVDFDREFETKERLLLAAQAAFLDGLWREVVLAAEAPREWPAKVGAGLGAALGSLAESGTLARVYTVEAPAASLAAAECQFVALERFAALLRGGRNHLPAASLPALTESLLVGGVAAIVTTHLRDEAPGALKALEPGLLETLLMPYLGRPAARRAAAGPGPSAGASAPIRPKAKYLI